jgi:hypothetical protein
MATLPSRLTPEMTSAAVVVAVFRGFCSVSVPCPNIVSIAFL